MFRPIHLGALYVGNYNLSPNGGIVYGHFPGAGGRVSGNPVRDNWLYGSTLSWNGLMWQYDEAGYSAIQAFYHERELERAWGALTGFKTGKRFDVYAGFSRLLVETPLDTGNQQFSGPTLLYPFYTLILTNPGLPLGIWVINIRSQYPQTP